MVAAPERAAARTLTLVRHAKSSWHFSLDDFQRPLNRRGLRDCQRLGPVLGARVPRPDLVVSSDAARAVQTCQVVGDALEVPASATRFERALYLADVETLLGVVRATDESVSHLLLVGHNPGLTDLHNALCDEYVDNLPTFAVAVLDCVEQRWSSLEAGTARLVELILPKSV